MNKKILFLLILGRFRRLKYIDQLKAETMIFTTAAACCFHNICIMEDDIAELLDYDDDDTDDVPVAVLPMGIFDANSRNRGLIRRNQEMQRL